VRSSNLNHPYLRARRPPQPHFNDLAAWVERRELAVRETYVVRLSSTRSCRSTQRRRDGSFQGTTAIRWVRLTRMLSTFADIQLLALERRLLGSLPDVSTSSAANSRLASLLSQGRHLSPPLPGIGHRVSVSRVVVKIAGYFNDPFSYRRERQHVDSPSPFQ